MKNFKIIESVLADYVDKLDNAKDLIPNLIALIQALPAFNRENALAIITGKAVLSILPADQVKISHPDHRYSNGKLFNAELDILKGVVTCNMSFTKTISKWYKSNDDAKNEIDGKDKMDITHTIEQQKVETVYYEDSYTVEKWNSGNISYPGLSGF